MIAICRVPAFAVVLLVTAISANAYTIKYNLNGGTNHPDNPTSYASGWESKLELKDPSREGYEFLGWYVVPKSDTLSTFIDFARIQGNWTSTVAYGLGSFTVEARWGLVPVTPKQDERGCYLIHTAEELYGIASVSKQIGDYSREHRYYFDGCISLQNDIVVNKKVLDENGNLSLEGYVSWIPIGFYGVFEGNGFKISGLVGENGLFEFVGNRYSWIHDISYVRNLGIEDSYFTGDLVGGIAGRVVGPMQLKNVYSNATVRSADMAGGLIGEVNILGDECPTAMISRASALTAKNIDSSNVVFVENAYSTGLVEGARAGGIISEMDAAILKNVYFAGELKSKSPDCIVQKEGFACNGSKRVFEVENALCLESKDTTVSKAVSLSKAQFADGTALEKLSAGENGSSWVQEVGSDEFPRLYNVQYGIHYVLNGGENSELNPHSYTKNDKAFALQDAVRDGDEFEGWFTDERFTRKVDSINTSLYGDWTLYAKWKSYFTINIDLNGGNRYKGNLEYENLMFPWSADSSTFVFERASRDGYEFEGWYTDTLFTNKITEVPAGNTEDVTVHAKWKMLEYTITYHLNGGVNDPENPTRFTVLDTGFVFKEPTREGAKFLYWGNSPLGYSVNQKIDKAKNYTLYAEWIPVPQQPKKNSKGCYLITTKEELYWLAELVNGGIEGMSGYETCASLQNDIVVNENVPKKSVDELDSMVYFNWKPFGIFEGTFAGNGHSISGLLVDDYCGNEEYYGGLFDEVWGENTVTGVTVKNTYTMRYGYIDSLRITGDRMALPSVAVKSGWQMDVHRKRLAFSGLVAGRPLLVMDVQGRVLQRLTTEPSMAVELPKLGRFFIRYGNETRAVTIR